jgi:hypothetical protein
MILLVLAVVIGGIALVGLVAWKLLGVAERMAPSTVFGKPIPWFGIMSILAIALGFLCYVFGLESDTGTGTLVAMSALVLGPLLGISFGVAGMLARERPGFIPWFGLLCSGTFVALYLLRLLRIYELSRP